MTDHESNLLREISNRLTAIETRQETIRTENREDHGEIFRKIEGITEGGCPLGKQHEKDILELKARPIKLMDLGAAVVSALCATISIWFSQRH